MLPARTGAHEHADRVSSPLDIDALAKFVDPLPLLPRATPAGVRDRPHQKAPVYRLEMRAVETRIHRDAPPTTFWSFGTTFPGPTIEARSHEGLWVDWINRLPPRHCLPIDHAIHGAEAGLPESRAVVHLHGARVPPEADGNPERWITPGQTAQYYYPNRQDAATLWYHDHTMGINRLNVYAGLMGAYLIRDDVEDELNLPRDDFDIPLIICDRLITEEGQLSYPVSPDPNAPWVSEVFGDALLVNGRLSPYLDVEPRKYRFRVINGSNGRFLRLEVSNGYPFTQIGTDQGLLSAPVAARQLVLAPAERADVVIDFAKLSGQVILTNDRRPAMQFRVRGGRAEDSSVVPSTLRPIVSLQERDAVEHQTHTLGELDDLVSKPIRMLLNGMRWHMPITERPVLDTTEIWSLANLTDDSHPIHLHLVRFQILDRRRFDTLTYLRSKRIVFTGPPAPPDPIEAGWKDTVRADPGMVTRIITRFDGYPGRYMWHCHILEHSDNEMMRPYEIVRPA
jgi:spore coat protein A